MKITVGGTMTMTVMNHPYEPIKVESTFHIEQEVNDAVDPQDVQEKYQEKVNKLIEKDLDNKMRVAAKKQSELKAKLSS